MIDYSPLGQAIAQLKIALEYAESHQDHPDLNMRSLMHYAAIQAFEFTYELSVRMIKRHLEEVITNPSEVEYFQFQDYIREAYARGLLSQELSVWKDFRTKRGTTSHAYDISKAENVYEAIPSFLQEVCYLYKELVARNS